MNKNKNTKRNKDKNNSNFFDANLLLILDDLADFDGAINLIVDSDFDSLDEAYELEIKSDKISIKAESAEGVFRGIKTLEQIIVLSQLAGGSKFLSLPGGKINDHPYYEYRGAMLDVARHFFSVTDVKRYIDILLSLIHI